jgi:hypothetical protein
MNEAPEEGKWYEVIGYDQDPNNNRGRLTAINYIKIQIHNRKLSNILGLRIYTSGNSECQMVTKMKKNIQGWSFNHCKYNYIIKDYDPTLEMNLFGL